MKNVRLDINPFFITVVGVRKNIYMSTVMNLNENIQLFSCMYPEARI